MPSPPDPIAFSVLGFDVRWYALFMLAGVLAGIALTRQLATRLGLERDFVLDAAPWVALWAILGARSYYVLLRADYFAGHPLEALNIRQGGLSFHGALVAGTVATVILCHRHRQPFLAWSDAAIPGIALAQAIGRWGNWANQEAFGTPTDLPWRLWIDPANRPAAFLHAEGFHPTFLYESLFNLGNAILLAWLAFMIPGSHKLRHGDVFAVYLISYGAARFLIEGLRTDSLYIGPLPAAYWLSWALIGSGIAILVWLRSPWSRRPEGNQSGRALD